MRYLPTVDSLSVEVAEAAQPDSVHSAVRESRSLLREQLGAGGLIASNATPFQRDIPAAIQNNFVQKSFFLYYQNPFAARLIDTFVDFIISDGIRPVSEDKRTQKALNDFWDDYQNNWEAMLQERIRNLLLAGEWLHRPMLLPDGRVRLSFFQPSIIMQTYIAAENHEFVAAIDVQELRREITTRTKVGVIHPAFDAKGNFTSYEGDFFYYRLRGTNDRTRGAGLLFSLVDHLDVFDEMLFDRAEKISAASSSFWSVELQGYSQQMIDEFRKKESAELPPKSGNVWFHNEKANLELISPDTHADQHAEDVQTQRTHILSSMGLPGTWFDSPGSAGRAVGAEMAEGTYKAIVSYQKLVNVFLRREIDYMLWYRGTIEGSEYKDYAIHFARPSVRDSQRISQSMWNLSRSLEKAIDKGYISRPQAARVFLDQLNESRGSQLPLEPDEKLLAGDESDAPIPPAAPVMTPEAPSEPPEDEKDE